MFGGFPPILGNIPNLLTINSWDIQVLHLPFFKGIDGYTIEMPFEKTVTWPETMDGSVDPSDHPTKQSKLLRLRQWCDLAYYSTSCQGPGYQSQNISLGSIYNLYTTYIYLYIAFWGVIYCLLRVLEMTNGGEKCWWIQWDRKHRKQSPKKLKQTKNLWRILLHQTYL